ncbi:MAG TPA: lanthionine synthetase LanC family protein [Streptosporangiaceae bacterium]
METDHDATVQHEARAAARAALRWVTDAGVSVNGAMTWPSARAPGAPLSDDLYFGTAGVLAALAEAKLGGLTEFDDHAGAAAKRLRQLARLAADDVRVCAPELEPEMDEPDLSLYTGLGGVAVALHMWAQVSGDEKADLDARALVRAIAARSAAERSQLRWYDVMSGQAGIMLVLVTLGDQSVRQTASDLADQLIAEARWIDGLPDWYPRRDLQVFQPNFSHGLAGIGFAFAVAGRVLGRADLLDIAIYAARRLIQLGARPDGTLAVPQSIPLANPQAPVSYGWCHGATGTLRLFEQLDQIQPEANWGLYAQASRQGVRSSGLPARLFPGFWDNLGQCCGTAGVGEMALDRYQQTGDKEWLAWAETLAVDVLNRNINDESGVRWAHTEHRQDPPELEPAVGFMQGTAGIASWLLRLIRVQHDGPGAATIWWPDRPDIR